MKKRSLLSLIFITTEEDRRQTDGFWPTILIVLSITAATFLYLANYPLM